MNTDAEFYHNEAYGKPGIHMPIAGHDCHVRREGNRWTVLDEDNRQHIMYTRSVDFFKSHVTQWFGGDWD